MKDPVTKNRLVKVGVIGIGNVGWALASLLIKSPFIDELLIAGRSHERITALKMDICSAYPEARRKIRFAELNEMAGADIIILTAGSQMRAGQSAADVREVNAEITRAILQDMTLKPSAILIALATPVDDITVLAKSISGLASNQVFGFGGDLDYNRLRYILAERNLLSEPVQLVGEHGANAIPVYAGEKDYPLVAAQVRSYLRTVTSLAGETRNLSTAILLTRLIESIASDTGDTHYLCGLHPTYGIYLTWGFAVGANGLGSPTEISLEAAASKDLEQLIILKRQLRA